MNEPVMELSASSPVDTDLAEQAVPGHGIPSQDPEPAAQVLLEPEEAQRESKSVLVGGGVVAGMATGAAIGIVVAGPVGLITGAAMGAVAGAVGGAAAGAASSPAESTNTTSTHSEPVHFHIEDSGGNGRPVALIHG